MYVTNNKIQSLIPPFRALIPTCLVIGLNADSSRQPPVIPRDVLTATRVSTRVNTRMTPSLWESSAKTHTLTLTSSSDVFPNFYFGCGQNNQGLFGRTAGLIGLGKDPLSIVSQTDQKYGKYFSYCLPSTPSSTGFLTLGKSGSPSNNLKFTPFSSSRGNDFYYIDIILIYVGGQQLPRFSRKLVRSSTRGPLLHVCPRQLTPP